MKKRISAVLWDFNGVIVADTQALYETLIHVTQSYGGRHFSLAEFKETTRMPTLDNFVDFGCDRERILAESAVFGKTLHDFYEARAEQCRTRRGVRDVLGFLRKKSISSTIFSNHTVWGIDAQLRRFGLLSSFTAVLANESQTESLQKRGKKDRVIEYLQKKSLDPETVIIIGDTTEEVEIGRELNLISVAITGGNHTLRRLRRSKPNHLIHNVSSLIRIVQGKK